MSFLLNNNNIPLSFLPLRVAIFLFYYFCFHCSNLLYASDESGSLQPTTRYLTFSVDQPCSIVIYLDITPKIQCYYREKTTDKIFEAQTGENIEEEAKQLAIRVFNLINIERVNHGLSKLKWNDRVFFAAHLHSIDMNNRDYFEHESPEGMGPNDRLETAQATFNSCGECIYKTKYNAADLSERVVRGWMNSPGHRAIILEQTFNQGAVGVHVSDDQSYFTFDAILGDK